MLLTVLFPGLSLLLRQRPVLAGVVVVLQLTLVGWPLATAIAGQHRHRQWRRQRRNGSWPSHSFVTRLLY